MVLVTCVMATTLVAGPITLMKAIGPATKVVAITHVTSTTGILYPAREIARMARQRGAWMHLDGAQSFGSIDVDLKDIPCDSYSTSAHKWLMGPLEAGILFVRAERIAQIWPSIVTAGWSDRLKGAPSSKSTASGTIRGSWP